MESQFPSSVLERIERCGIIAVLVVDKLEHAVPLARSLLEGGFFASHYGACAFGANSNKNGPIGLFLLAV